MRRGFPGHIVFDFFLQREGVHIGFYVAPVGVKQFLEGFKGRRMAHAPVIDQVIPVKQRDLQRLQKVDDAAGRAEALVRDHVFAAAEGDVLRGGFFVQTEGVHHGRDVDLVPVEHRVDPAVREVVIGHFKEGRLLPVVKAQRQLWQRLPEKAGRADGEAGEAVRRGLVPPPLAAHDDAGVGGAAPLVGYTVEFQNQA